ncbi:MAG: Clp protease N-terminal domain-containing protein, partial [Leptospiraceae bacterium]|nr:Clp protease N-terminal domain-containing protein [Leptospiraceae bacterium]
MEAAMQTAQRFRHLEVSELHLLHALFSNPESYFTRFFQSLGLSVQSIVPTLETLLCKLATYT